MKITSPFHCSVVISAVALCCTHSVTAADFEWQGSVAKNGSVTIRGVNGKVLAKPASDNTIVLEVNKRAKRSDPDSVEIQVVEDAQGVLICAVYPNRAGKGTNKCARGDDYKMNVKNNDVVVNFTVDIPSGVDFDAGMVNGGIKIRGLSGDVNVVTVNGGIDVETDGVVLAKTVNGGIDARMGTSPSKQTSFTTVNGAIDLELSDNVNAALDIQTVNGRIKSDFPLERRGKWGPKSASGDVGDGGAEIQLSTVNGSVRVTRE